MAKITRAYQKVFGDTGVASDFGEFGSLAAGTPTTTKDPATIQSLPAWLGGWAQATIGALIPAYQDMNSVHFLAFRQICYLLQMGVAEYDASTSYYINSICQDGGQFYVSLIDDNVGNSPSSSPTQWQSGIPGTEITGVIKEYAGATAPNGYLMANGSPVSRSTYSALFAVCGVVYGAGNGTTTFNLPDRRRSVGVGYMPSDPDFGTLGKVGGETTHTLIVAEVPSLSVSIPLSSPNAGGTSGIPQNTPGPADGSPSNYATSGGGGAHNNIQPYQVYNYIIKY